MPGKPGYSPAIYARTLDQPPTAEIQLLLNNDAQDASGQGHHGTATAITFDAMNKREGSHGGVWDAPTDRLTVPMTAFAAPAPLTIALSVKPTAFGSLQYLIGTTTVPRFANRIQLCTSATGMLQVGLGSSPGCSLNPAVLLLALSAWYHLVLRLEDGVYALDVDGVRRAEGPYVGLTALASTLTIGNNQGLNTQAWQGVIDAVQIVGRAWSDAEVATAYARHRGLAGR